MKLAYDVIESATSPVIIKVIGLGGGDCSTINNTIKNTIQGTEFINASTGAQSLSKNNAAKRIQLGTNLTRGLGAGTNPGIGRATAQEDREAVEDVIHGANMLFITTGMDGGTGIDAAPVVAEIVKEVDILTVAIVTRPSGYEGKRVHIAQVGLEQLKSQVDSLIIIPSDKLITALGEDVTIHEAFRAADNVLHNTVAGISEVVARPGFISLDFADVKDVVGIRGIIMMGPGYSQGIDRARLTTEHTISSLLLDNVTLDDARGVPINITITPDYLKMSEYREIMRVVNEDVHPEAKCRYGTAEDDNMGENAIRVTIIATGLEESNDANQFRAAAHTQQLVDGTDNVTSQPHQHHQQASMDGLVHLGYSARSMNLTAADFGSQSVLDDFEIPAILRCQHSVSDE